MLNNEILKFSKSVTCFSKDGFVDKYYERWDENKELYSDYGTFKKHLDWNNKIHDFIDTLCKCIIYSWGIDTANSFRNIVFYIISDGLKIKIYEGMVVESSDLQELIEFPNDIDGYLENPLIPFRLFFDILFDRMVKKKSMRPNLLLSHADTNNISIIDWDKLSQVYESVFNPYSTDDVHVPGDEEINPDELKEILETEVDTQRKKRIYSSNGIFDIYNREEYNESILRQASRKLRRITKTQDPDIIDIESEDFVNAIIYG